MVFMSKQNVKWFWNGFDTNDRTMIVQWSFSDRTMLEQWSYNDLTMIVQRFFNYRAMFVQWSCNDRAMIVQWSCIDCTKILQWLNSKPSKESCFEWKRLEGWFDKSFHERSLLWKVRKQSLLQKSVNYNR